MSIKKHLPLIALFTGLLTLCGFSSQNASAYWTDDGNGTQCYAIQYEGKNVEIDKEAQTAAMQCMQGCDASDGGCILRCDESAQTQQTTAYTIYSTNQICANVDDSGKILSLSSPGIPSDTTAFNTATDGIAYPSLAYSLNNTVVENFCSSGLNVNYCIATSRLKTTYSTNGSGADVNVSTFRELAESIQNSYSGFNFDNFTLLGIDANSTNTQAQEKNTTAVSSIAGDDNSSSASDACYTGSGALGWVLCPVVEMASETMTNLYASIEKDYLQISPSFLAADGSNNGTYQAWQIFRNLANVVFVILLLVIIFSQLTGVGISNYGIKKALPKLIVVAVLINLSFILCQLAVDISNIVGAALNDLLTNIASRITGGALPTSGDAGQYIVTFGVGGAVTTVVALAALFVNPGGALVVALAIISALIAVFFLWVILMVRQVGVIIAVVLAPLAFACYLLPNTEKIGKKWLDLFKKLLLLYPLCALVIGGGRLASRIVAANAGDNEWLALSAMLLQVLPFFAIPSLMKASLAGFGALGDKISNLGQKATAGTVGKYRQSEAFKRHRTSLNGVDPRGVRSKIANKVGNVPGLKPIANTVARQTNAAQQQRNADVAAATTLYANQFGGEDWNDGDNGALKEYKKAFDKGDQQKVEALASFITSKYGKVGIDAIAQHAHDNAKGDNKNHKKSAQALHGLAQKNSAFASFAAKHGDFNDYLNTGGSQDASTFAQNSSLSTIEDFAGQSSGALRRMAEGGALTPEMANRILNSTAPNIQNGILSDDGKVAILRSVANRSANGTYLPPNVQGPVRPQGDYSNAATSNPSISNPISTQTQSPPSPVNANVQTSGGGVNDDTTITIDHTHSSSTSTGASSVDSYNSTNNNPNPIDVQVTNNSSSTNVPPTPAPGQNSADNNSDPAANTDSNANQ